jgi:EAL and modified HD-GYP domain-containing signal transduction protein
VHRDPLYLCTMTPLIDPGEPAPQYGAPLSHARDFFLARQPILDRSQGLIAYELLFRSAASGPANVTDDLLATASVMANAFELGMNNVVGNALAFVNIDAAVLMSDFVKFLPSDKVILEILETVQVTPAVIERIRQLALAGFRFALDDVIATSADVMAALPVVTIIKIDIRDMTSADLHRLSARFKSAGKKLLAEKVETLAEFEQCMALGFDYFQGYYFAKPVVLTGKKLSPPQLAIMNLMELIRKDADGNVIEKTIKQDASLGLNLLRLVNTPGAGVLHRIDSLSQAVMVLGRLQLQRWLQILLYAEPRKAVRSVPPLLILATTRGKLLELITSRLHPGNRTMADKAFTVGIMSLMDALFGQPMENILEQISVADEVRQALLGRSGTFGEILQLVEALERIEQNSPSLLPALDRLGLPLEELNVLQLEAFEWSNSIAGSA